MKKLRIVFFGTPEFAVPSLKIIYESNYEIAAVITAVDRPKGRGKKLEPSEIKKYAESVGLTVLQPENLKAETFISTLKALEANLFVVVAFRMLPESVWNMPEYGTFNLHASLLPNYRGAAPINWAIINGEKETGLTTFFLKHEIDTGNIISQKKEPIFDEDDTGTLYVRLMEKGADLVLETLQLIEQGEPETFEQTNTGNVKPAPKIFRDTCQIDWNKSSTEIRNFIRGLSPYPGAWTIVSGKNFKIFSVEQSSRTGIQGELEIKDGELFIGTADGSIKVLQLQAEGKRRMTTEDYLKGNPL